MDLSAQLGVFILKEVCCHLLSQGVIIESFAFLFNVSGAHPAYFEIESTRVFRSIANDSALVGGITLIGIAERNSVVANTISGSGSFLKQERGCLRRLTIIYELWLNAILIEIADNHRLIQRAARNLLITVLLLLLI